MTRATPHVVVAPDPAAVAEAGARLWVDSARQAVPERPVFAVALAGGNTPRELYRAVAQQPDLDWAWHRTHIFFTDERAVDPRDARSNFRLAREALLDDVPLAASQVHRLEADAPDLEMAARDYEAALRTVLAPPPHAPPALDLVFLGVGSDGHTASLFPGARSLEVRDRWVLAVDEPAAQPPRRLTLSLPVLSAALRIVFVVTGREKAEVVARVLEGDAAGAGAARPLPAALVHPAPGRLVWLLDEAAASRLTRTPRGVGA